MPRNSPRSVVGRSAFSFRFCMSVPGLLRRLPYLRSLFEIEVLVPIATGLARAWTARAFRLHRQGFRLFRHGAYLNRQVSFANPHRQRTVEPLLYSHVAATQSTDDR